MIKTFRLLFIAFFVAASLQAAGAQVRTLAAPCGGEGTMLLYSPAERGFLKLEKLGPFFRLAWALDGISDSALFYAPRARRGDDIGVVLGGGTRFYVCGRPAGASEKTPPLPGEDFWSGNGTLWTRALTAKELREYSSGRKNGALAVSKDITKEKQMDHSLAVYDRSKYMLPFWSSDVIYHETVMFVEGDKTALLMYPAEEIFEVSSSDLETLYKEGEDYRLEDGALVLCENGSLPVMPLSEFYPDPATALPGTYFECTVEGHPLLGFSETPKFIEKQIAVTYRPSGRWEGPVPERQPKFDRFLKKLLSGEPVTVVYFGDSISTGANSSSVYGRKPNAENWCRMSCSAMEDISGNGNVTYINTAVGGMESIWAVDNIEERVTAYDPDLVVYAFGMNDHTKPAEEFIRLTDLSVSGIREACPECDVLLVSTMLPHKRARGFWNNQDIYEDAMKEYVKDKEHVGLAPVTGIHRYLLTRKEYYHATGNNVNHPNDFLARMYAQTVIKVIFGR